MKQLGITCIQNCPNCGQMWVNLNLSICLKCDAGLATSADVPTTNSTQAGRDLDRLIILVCRTLGGTDWVKANDDQILEEFDPWDCLRKVGV